MNTKTKVEGICTTAAVLVSVGLCPALISKTHSFQASVSSTKESTQTKIDRALSAGPPEVAAAATVAEIDDQGKMKILRPGTNGFTCMSGNPKVIADPPMCADAASMQWAADFKAHKPKPTNTIPGITCMLAGATQRSDKVSCSMSSASDTLPNMR